MRMPEPTYKLGQSRLSFNEGQPLIEPVSVNRFGRVALGAEHPPADSTEHPLKLLEYVE
jgi:hypothetical protein